MKKYSLLLILLLGLFYGCGQNEHAFKFSGTIEMTEHSLGAKAAGRISTLNVNEGDTVKKNQVIATLDRFEQTKKDFQRIENLYKQGGATLQDLEYAKLAMDDQQIISPVDGVVLVKVHEIGETVPAGSAVIVIGDRSNLWVRIYVPEGRINLINLNQPATFSFDGIKKTSKGHVSFIASKAEFTPRNVQTSEERVTQTFAVKIVIDDAPEFLRPGVAADVVIDIKE